MDATSYIIILQCTVTRRQKWQPVKILFSPIILHNSKHQHSAGVCCYLVLCVKIKPKCLIPLGAFSPVVPCWRREHTYFTAIVIRKSVLLVGLTDTLTECGICEWKHTWYKLDSVFCICNFSWRVCGKSAQTVELCIERLSGALTLSGPLTTNTSPFIVHWRI